MTDTAATIPADLVARGLLDTPDVQALTPVTETFRMRITPQMLAAIGAPDDKIARQFIPDQRELTIRPEELADPIGDAAHAPAPGITHRYPDRVIFHVTQLCEVYCRFCFRREVVGDSGVLPPDKVAAALDYIRATPAIHEVILTGGDPLSLSPRRIAALTDALAAIPHVRLLRIHTRVPVVAPERISAEMLKALQRDSLTTWIVLHTNHAQELVPAAESAIGSIIGAGIPMLSQSVLLRGVNDDVDTLQGLFTSLLRLGVKPYYLHHCDLARGTSHFRTTIAAGRALMAALRGRISGTALPTYVLDIPGGFGKVPINADYFVPSDSTGTWQVQDPQGRWHIYQDPE
ncbi:lysine-2,3-aminomutase-like protein [Ketogulonicigenium robustum]|uniref:lysine-2,3-aminomutase-like protein n=1 Tax=Ketogulonicigenium robustum TaxID=92947 RepID=UPI000A26A63E|nr:lysine-2,3-aminomutase-like protein [Ketogulonicigenium robustum]